MIMSMTGFAGARGEMPGWQWQWDLRAVNGKGLDLRLRLPDWIEGLEGALRAELGRVLTRGNVSLTLKLSREGEASGAAAFRLNAGALGAALTALAEVQHKAEARGLALRAASPAEVLALRGILETSETEPDPAPLRAALLADFAPLLLAFQTARAGEGAALRTVIAGQIDRIATLVAEAALEAEARRGQQDVALREALSRLLANGDGLDEARLMQELALLAVKNDVTEELDRLRAHVEAARGLLDDGAAVGRRFDFLMQEFMREANTLCSKSQSRALTRIGLDLKTVIDQMREQVQNVE